MGLGNCQSHPESTAVGVVSTSQPRQLLRHVVCGLRGDMDQTSGFWQSSCSSFGKAMQEKPPEERETKDKPRRGILTATENACDCTPSKSAVQCQPYLGQIHFPPLSHCDVVDLVSILSHLPCPQTITCPPRATPMVQDQPINFNASLRDFSKCASQCIR